jgi:shikimate kinase
MKKYILIGIPDCGKTTLGSKVAKKLNMPFFDTDKMTYAKLNPKNPMDLFRSGLNGQFLEAQSQVVLELANMKKSAIIATGAEVALSSKNAKAMKNMGTIIYIKRDPNIVLAGLQRKGSNIVLINQASGKKIDIPQETVNLYTQECAQYEALADLTLENDGSVKEGVEKLIELITAAKSP